MRCNHDHLRKGVSTLKDPPMVECFEGVECQQVVKECIKRPSTPLHT